MKRRAKGKKPTTDWRTHPVLVAYDKELIGRIGTGIERLFEGAIDHLDTRIAVLEAAIANRAPDLSGEQSQAFQELAERGVE
jgi:hypothetical protein